MMKLKRIVIIGPFYPYKGGIANHTDMIANKFSKTYEVVGISFKLQYPRVLYKKPQKIEKNATNREYSVFEMINTLNPISWVNVARYINNIKPDIVLIQWWHPYFSFTYWVILKLISRKIKIVMQCHNVLPHEKFPIKNLLARTVLKNADSFIVHSKQDADDLKRLLKNPRYIHCKLPINHTYNWKAITQSDARDKLEITSDCLVLLFFGFIRDYKGLRYLIEAIQIIKDNVKNVKLLIVGDYFNNDKELYLNLINELNLVDYISLHEGYIPDEEVCYYFTSCDIVILPYISATQTGIVPISYSFFKPVIVTDVGGLPESVEDGITGYIIKPRDPKAIANAVIDFSHSNKNNFSMNIKNELSYYSWEMMINNIESL